MPKSQEDPETIEEAIARLISEHNEDNQSHLLSGQSIDEHRKEPILDHPAGSVLADKMTDSEDMVELNFETLDCLDHAGAVSVANGPALNLRLETPDVNLSYAYTILGFGGNWLDFSKNLLFQFSASNFGELVNFKAFFIFGSYASNGKHGGLGFVWEGSVVKGFVEKIDDTLYTADLSVDNKVVHVYRVLWNAIEKKAYFYIDGLFKALISVDSVGVAFEPQLHFRLAENGSAEGSIIVRRVKASREQ